MSFLSPALLIGLLAAAIPPLIHLIHRRRARTVRFPALEFILRSNRKTARRFRVKQLLLMLVRSLLLALVAFALAQPYVSHVRATIDASISGGGATVIVLDASYPMAYDLEGETLLERARLLAGQVLDNLGADGQAALTIAADRVEVPLSDPTRDLTAIRRALSDLQPSAHTGHLAEAVSRAYEILADQPRDAPRRVIVLTTPAGAFSARANLPKPPGDEGDRAIELLPIDVAQGRPLPNRAVLEVHLRQAPELGAGQWRIDARIGNFAVEAAEYHPIWLEVDGEPVVRGFVNMGPGEVVTKTFHVRLEGQGARRATLVLGPDGLAADDRRDFWLQPAPQIQVLAVNGDPRPIRYRDELFYLERALAPRSAAGVRVRLKVADRDTLARYELSDFDVIVLANTSELPPRLTQKIEAFVRAGGGLLITMGDQVDPAVANRSLANLLPRQLRNVRFAGDAAASAEGGDRRSAHPGTFARGHPILAPFSNPATTSLSRAGVRRYMLLDPAPDASGEVVITLDEGAPLLLTRALERGRIALLTTSVDRDWSDLPIRPDFLPLMQQTMRYLTQVADLNTAPVLVGHPAEIAVEDPRVHRVMVRVPDGSRQAVERPLQEDPRGEAKPWRFGRTDLPGHYQIEADPPLPGGAALPGFAVAVDPAAADLRGGGATPATRAEEQERRALLARSRTELWHLALGGLFLMLAAEAALLFRRRRWVPQG